MELQTLSADEMFSFFFQLSVEYEAVQIDVLNLLLVDFPYPFLKLKIYSSKILLVLVALDK